MVTNASTANITAAAPSARYGGINIKHNIRPTIDDATRIEVNAFL